LFAGIGDRDRHFTREWESQPAPQASDALQLSMPGWHQIENGE
jgi:hypothetical protein